MNLMLEFVASHGIVPWVETGKLNLEGIQAGVDRLRKGLTRYRYHCEPEMISNYRFVAIAEDGM